MGAIWLVVMFGSILGKVIPFFYLEVVACQEIADHFDIMKLYINLTIWTLIFCFRCLFGVVKSDTSINSFLLSYLLTMHE